MNRKGHRCPYKPITCQEGICQNCSIWQERQERMMSHLEPIERARIAQARPDWQKKEK